jgi:hypothetical protein
MFVSSLDLPSRIFKYFLSISLYLPFVSNPVSSYIPLWSLPISQDLASQISLHLPRISSGSHCRCPDLLLSPTNLFVSPINLNIFSQNLPVFPSDVPGSLYISPRLSIPDLPVFPLDLPLSPLCLQFCIFLGIPCILSGSPCISPEFTCISPYIFPKSSYISQAPPCTSPGSPRIFRRPLNISP